METDQQIANTVKALRSVLSQLQFDRGKAQLYINKAKSEEQRNKIVTLRNNLESRANRVEMATEVLSGRSFIVYDVNGELTLVKPSEQTAKLIEEAEKHGAVVSKYDIDFGEGVSDEAVI